jgi:hypothetical protein
MDELEDVIVRLRTLDELFNTQSQKKGKVFLEYYFSEQDQETYLCISRPISFVTLLDTDGSALNESKLIAIKGEHDLLFAKDPDESINKFAIWDKIFSIFLRPMMGVIEADFLGYIFVLSEVIIGTSDLGPFINIQSIYDLSFFYTDNRNISKLIFVNISDPEPIRFLRKLQTAPLPLAKDMDILYGFPKNDESPAGLFREIAFKEGKNAAEVQGARIYTINGLGLFEQLFSTENKGRVIQMLTHFHKGRIFTPELKYIRVADLKKVIERMFLEDKLRNDTCIHAVTCNNFSFFKVLYQSGIKNIYYSSNELLTNEIAAMFWELYHGRNAAKIDLAFPYLDGKSFVFEAWTKVARCFYRNSFLKTKIEIYMTTQIMLEGALTDDFLEYLDERKETLTGIEYRTEFKDANPDEAGFMVLLPIILDFVKDVAVELLATLLADFIAKKVKERTEKANDAGAPHQKELRIVNSEIDLYAANYSKEELVEILAAISPKTE